MASPVWSWHVKILASISSTGINDVLHMVGPRLQRLRELLELHLSYIVAATVFPDGARPVAERSVITGQATGRPSTVSGSCRFCRERNEPATNGLPSSSAFWAARDSESGVPRTQAPVPAVSFVVTLSFLSWCLVFSPFGLVLPTQQPVVRRQPSACKTVPLPSRQKNSETLDGTGRLAVTRTRRAGATGTACSPGRKNSAKRASKRANVNDPIEHHLERNFCPEKKKKYLASPG
ncbi:hypothetical protein B0H17DRAFT_1141635 [Mycena rosella]|uniref:Uncharacterized protein n=1 Tax=Mycena rosella TaxID=1033263 RepID=A0AAD7CZ59_MYCRO|nr:hypothetical protein B0H17DRAFT_1141635 [Mycena rosella]